MSISFLYGVRGPSAKIKRSINRSQMNGGDYQRRKELTSADWAEIRKLSKPKKQKGNK